MTFKFSPLAATLLLLFAGNAAAVPLQQILRNALQNDPTVLEARANEQAAQSSVKEARAGHYPIVSVKGTQMVAQHHRHDYDRNTDKFSPSLNANLNLYAWGGIESGVRQNEHKVEHFYHKISETQEELGNTIGKLYLGALRAKELIAASQNNIVRHERIVSDLHVIAKHDKGRQSELDQALDRKLRAEGYLIEQTHQLENYLSRLGKYTGTMLSPSDLEDPFVQETQTSLTERYRNEDLANLPSYLAQQAEKERIVEEVNVAKAARYPRINLVGTADRDNREIYVNFDWAFYNPAAKYNAERTAHTLTVAETKMDQILRDVAERSRNAQIDMTQYMRRYQLAQQQIASQQRVIKAYELQFKIARRTLIDVLDSYADLSNIEINAITAQNNYRDAALEYLASQSSVSKWIGMSNVAPSQNSTSYTIADKPEVLTQEKVAKTVPTTEKEATIATFHTKNPVEKSSLSELEQPKQIVPTEVEEVKKVKVEKNVAHQENKAALPSAKFETKQPNPKVVQKEKTQNTISQDEGADVPAFGILTPQPITPTSEIAPEVEIKQLPTASQPIQFTVEPVEKTFRQPEVIELTPLKAPAEKSIIIEALSLIPTIEPANNIQAKPLNPLEPIKREQTHTVIDPNEDIIATSIFNPTEIQLP
ncbi:TolC family protein [Neisseriaceae bacterium B1]